MKKIFTNKLFAALWLLCLCISPAYSQSTSISGSIVDEETGEPIAGVNLIVKGKVIGTISNENGEFSLTVRDSPPFTIVASFVGFRTEEIEIMDPETSGLRISMVEELIFGREIVVSASRVEQDIMESPVTIEQMDIRAIREAATPSFYDALRTLK